MKLVLTNTCGIKAITGFPPGIYSRSEYIGDAAATAQADSLTAFNMGKGLAATVDYAGLAELSGLVLVPGVCK